MRFLNMLFVSVAWLGLSACTKAPHPCEPWPECSTAPKPVNPGSPNQPNIPGTS